MRAGETQMRTHEYLIHELTVDGLSDFLEFFDDVAFADNPEWSSCYCLFPHAPHHAMRWQDRVAADNRAASCARIREGQMRGYLAYHAGKPVAWCNAGRREWLTILDEDPELTGQSVGSIACFVVAKPHRGQGVARRLLEAACNGFNRDGVAIVEAYPRKDESGEAANHYGPLSMYLSAGFDRVRDQDQNVIVRKRLR
jgi:GNAT superfamily N-acetyltransferase